MSGRVNRRGSRRARQPSHVQGAVTGSRALGCPGASDAGTPPSTILDREGVAVRALPVSDCGPITNEIGPLEIHLKLTFLGTRGNIEPRTERHRMHTSLLVGYYDTEVMIDCGQDWRGRLDEIGPGAVVVTHAHPDHAWGLKDGADCPVYATAEAWEELDGYPLNQRQTVVAREPFEVGTLTFEAFPVEHSLRAPAVGYRVTAGPVTVFYVPDVAWIPDREAALEDVKVYIGDGATLTRSMVRRKDDKIYGHVPVRAQLTWCQKEGVPRCIVTHCGSGIVKNEAESAAKLDELAQERGVEARIAHDGLEVVLRGGSGGSEDA